jgi:RNA polymerase sigma-70 factor (ECF subfamily)
VTLALKNGSDAELAALTIAGRQDAFAAIMQRHEIRIYRIVRSNIGDADEALDITQEVFVAAYLALSRYDPARPLINWLVTIALNKCRDWSRRRVLRRLLRFAFPIDDSVAAIADDSVRADDALADRQNLAAVMRALPALPAQLKEPLILCTIDGLSQSEAGALLGISEKAVETRIRRARLRLAEILNDA